MCSSDLENKIEGNNTLKPAIQTVEKDPKNKLATKERMELKNNKKTEMKMI